METRCSDTSAPCELKHKIKIIHASPRSLQRFHFFFRCWSMQNRFTHTGHGPRATRQSMITFFFSIGFRRVFFAICGSRNAAKKENNGKRIYRRRCIASLNKQNFNALFMRTPVAPCRTMSLSSIFHAVHDGCAVARGLFMTVFSTPEWQIVCHGRLRLRIGKMAQMRTRSSPEYVFRFIRYQFNQPLTTE